VVKDQPEEKEGIPNPTTYKKYRFLKCIVYSTAILLWIAVYHHLAFEYEPKEILEADEQLKKVKRLRNNTATSMFPLTKDLREGTISLESFLRQAEQKEKDYLEYKTSSDDFFSQSLELREKNNTFGFYSYNIFAFNLGIQISFLLSILVLFAAIFIKQKPKGLQIAFKVALFNFLVSNSFYFLWIFYTHDEDLGLWLYILIGLIIAIGSALIVFLSLKTALKKVQEVVDNNQLSVDIAKKLRETFDLVEEKYMKEKI